MGPRNIHRTPDSLTAMQVVSSDDSIIKALDFSVDIAEHGIAGFLVRGECKTGTTERSVSLPENGTGVIDCPKGQYVF
jgi:hypothetical protein